MPKVKLTSPFWDGTTFHKRGEVIEVSEGAAVPPSIEVKEKEPELDLGDKAPAKKPETDKK